MVTHCSLGWRKHIAVKAYNKLVLVYEAKHHQKSSQTLLMFALPYSPLCFLDPPTIEILDHSIFGHISFYRPYSFDVLCTDVDSVWNKLFQSLILAIQSLLEIFFIMCTSIVHPMFCTAEIMLLEVLWLSDHNKRAPTWTIELSRGKICMANFIHPCKWCESR